MQITDEDLATIPGWLAPLDTALVQWFLDDQAKEGLVGNLVELGVYFGKSAILIGSAVRDNETFTVVDLFESDAVEGDNIAENRWYDADGLTRQAFEDNYLKFHPSLPTIVQGLSSEICDHVEPRSVRLCHVDASHHYVHVAGDLLSARKLMCANGVTIFDDYRSAHCPGVAAAVWEGVAKEALRPVVLSENKLYGTWGDPFPMQERLMAWFPTQPRWEWRPLEIQGSRVLRAFPAAGATSLNNRFLRDLLPPIIIRAGRSVRRRRQHERGLSTTAR